jgi:excinuclease ABC subunit C
MSEALFMIQRIRDEAHRFAITFQRQRRRKDITSVLTSIPGVGAKKSTLLLKHFGSVAALKNASATDLAGLPGVTPELAEVILANLKS